MTVIAQKELRNQVGEILRRVEAGETMIVTVAGRPVAELSPANKRTWVAGAPLERVWAGPSPSHLEEDLEGFPGEVSDPYTS
ncbi:MAG: type II toxin-antitoxin system prevent-host-death family antitoxin [Acidimicrobiales bacterium]|nr:type II toxin-antitoxin system prevent-host-death family antitoxin [Acidimicrobiales bacterium]